MSRRRAGDPALTDALADARRRDGSRALIGEAEMYCTGDVCAVRTVSVQFKEYDDPLPARLTCPACGRRLKLHHVWTLAEMNQDFEVLARASVNTQLWQREHPDELAVPLGVFLDDRLPGTRP